MPQLDGFRSVLNVPSQLLVNQRFNVSFYHPVLPTPLVTAVCYLVEALHVRQLSVIEGGDMLLKTSS